MTNDTISAMLLAAILCVQIIVPALIVFLYNRYAEHTLKRQMQEAQTAEPLMAQVISVRQEGAHWDAILRPTASCVLPETVTLSFRTPPTAGHQAELFVFRAQDPPAVMTREDFLSHCFALQEQELILRRRGRKRYLIVYSVIFLLDAIFAFCHGLINAL